MLILRIRSIKIKEAKKKWLSFSREHSTVICVYLPVCCLCPLLECKFHEGKDYKGLSFSPRSSQCPEKCPCSMCLTNTPQIFGEIMTFIVSPNLRKLVTTKYSRHLQLLLLMSPISNIPFQSFVFSLMSITLLPTTCTCIPTAQALFSSQANLLASCVGRKVASLAVFDTPGNSGPLLFSSVIWPCPQKEAHMAKALNIEVRS